MPKKPARKPVKKKRTKRNIAAAPGVMSAVQSYLSGGKPNVSVEELIALAESRFDSEEAKKAFDERLSAIQPGTVGAAKFVTAGDAIEDEELLLDLARKGFLEAIRSHTLRRRIVDEAQDIVSEIANSQAAVGWSSPDDRWPGAWTIADFGDVVAVNGVLLNDDDKVPERPQDYVLTNRGGRIPQSEEIVHPTAIVGPVQQKLDIKGDEAGLAILEVLSEDEPHGIPVVVKGETEVWMSPEGLEEPGFDLSIAEGD